MPFKISIIIPTCNRKEWLCQTLDALLLVAQRCEIIVVNDGEFIDLSIDYPTVIYFDNPIKGVANARNFGAKNSRCEYLLFLDDDILITQETINAIDLIIESEHITRAAILLNWNYPDSLIHKMDKSKIGRYLKHHKFHTMESRTGFKFNYNKMFIPCNSIGSATLVISKNVFNQVGGYNEHIEFQGEDIDLTNRLRLNDIGIFIYTPVTCYHNDFIAESLDSYLSRLHKGFVSQYKAYRQGIVSYPQSSKFKTVIYRILLPFFGLIRWFFLIIPNTKSWDFISFKLINIFSSITKIKAQKIAKID